MAFRGFTEAKHKDGALNDLETRVKNTFNQVKNSRILGGSLLSGVKLKSTASTSSYQVGGIGRSILTVDAFGSVDAATIITVLTDRAILSKTRISDWVAGTSNAATALSIANAFAWATANPLGFNVYQNGTGSDEVEILCVDGVLNGVLLLPKVTGGGFICGDIEPTISMVPLASALDFSVNEFIRFGPRIFTSPSEILPGVSRVNEVSTSAGSVKYLKLGSLPPAMRGGLYAYKLLRNPIPGVGSGSKYMILNQDRPSNIWSGAGGGSLSLFCDNDCTVDMWVF
tara:strand:- start:4318 stop:5172 length:855 start_codon:yes stop_codon:yes gene_type:complete